MAEPIVRPRAGYLAKLPTQDTMTADRVAKDVLEAVRAEGLHDFCLELKLVTERCKYWLCTEGFGRPPSAGLAHFVAGYVTVEVLGEDGDMIAYGLDEGN